MGLEERNRETLRRWQSQLFKARKKRKESSQTTHKKEREKKIKVKKRA